jgi:hypothetical protein
MMKKQNLSSVLVIVIFFMSNLLQAQEQPGPIYKGVQPIQLSGPRIGVTFLSDKYVDKIRSKYGVELGSSIAQFGWQFETRFFTMKSGATAVTEWVFLIGGFEQEKFLPSLSWLIGFRSAGGFEFGGGPNIALSGTCLVLAVGVTIKSEEINFPINLALATSKSGPRFSLLFGFNMR